jgi:hydrogenase nickel incorporation protein HypA/HybF
MHEMSLVQGIIEICEEHAAGKKVLSLEIELGELSGVVAESIEFCFDACSRGTLLEGARLHIIKLAGSGYCQNCKTETVMATFYDSCSNCGGYKLSLTSGKEMRVASIEVED